LIKIKLSLKVLGKWAEEEKMVVKTCDLPLDNWGVFWRAFTGEWPSKIKVKDTVGTVRYLPRGRWNECGGANWGNRIWIGK